MVQEKLSSKPRQDQRRPQILSPLGDPTVPDSLTFDGADRFWRLFSRQNWTRPPLKFRRCESSRDFFERAAEAKLQADLNIGYDISVTPYPLAFDPQGWGILSDRVGRLFAAALHDGDHVELQYQGGRCRTFRDWRALVGSPNLDEEDQIRSFYNRMRVVADKRITVAGTMGFGFWDTLWMSFDFDTAVEMLSTDSDFAQMVFRHWKLFHVGAANAMLDAGVKMIFFRENPGGFLQSRAMSARLDPLLRRHFSELSHAVHSRGGSLFLDCDADEMIETEYPAQWGFDGIGPLLFRDADDLISARRSLDEKLVLVGATLFPVLPGTLRGKRIQGRDLILAIANGSFLPLERREVSPGAFAFSKSLGIFDFSTWIRVSQ